MSIFLRLNYLKIAVFFFLLPLYLLPSYNGSAQVIWSSPAGAAWLTGANWTGGVVPSSTQVAEFDANPTSATTGVGIDMGLAGGSVSISGLYISSARTNNFLVGNSAATNGTLHISGDVINGTSNVFIGNFSANYSKLTIQNKQGIGTATLGLDLGSSSGNLTTGTGTSTAAGNTIAITSIINGTGALTLLGAGTWNAALSSGNNGGILKLGAANTFTGGITAGVADGTNSGILELDTTTAIDNVSGNNITIQPNSQLYLSAANGTTYTTDNITLYLSGFGNNYTATGKGALVNLSGDSYTWTGPISLAADASISALGTATITLNGNVSGTGKLIKEGPGNLAVNGTLNTWSGGTQINKGTITVSATSALPTGDLSMNAASTSSLVLNNSQMLTGLASNFGVSTGSFTQSISLASGTTLTINQSTNTTYGNGAVNSLSSVITGSGAVVKSNTGTLTLTSAGNTFSGGLTVSGGTLDFSPVSTPSTINSDLTLNGGTFSTNGIASVTLSFGTGTLILNDNSTFDLSTAVAHVVKFANSSTATWTSGKTLTITNWAGTYAGAGGTRGRIFVGTTNTGLTTAQLAQIKFNDGMGHLYNAVQMTTGEVIPLSPVITTTPTAYGPFCSNVDNTITVSFSSSGPFSGIYKVQLSSPSGVFTADTTTGVIGSGASSPITVTIPAGTAPGNAYKIRIINTSPAFYGSDNGSNIVLTGNPVVNPITGLSAITAGASLPYSDATSGGIWNSSDTTIASVTVAGLLHAYGPGTDTLYYTVTNSCGFTTIVSKLITVLPLATLASISPSSGAPGDTITITGTNFSTSAANSVVYFGSAFSPVFSASTSMLKTTVPVSAAYGPLSVVDTVLGIDAYSQYAFTPTYNNSGLIPDSFNFKPIVSFTAAATPVGVSLADIDGDGKPDMIVVNSGPNNIYVYRNISSGSGISSASYAAPLIYSTSAGPHYVKVADVDGDGKADILVTNTSPSANNISIFRNTSVSGIIAFAPRVNIGSGGSGPYDLSVTDIDGDGRPDMVVTNEGTTSFFVLKNRSVKGTLSFAGAIGYSVGANPFRLYTGDLDGDGKPDVVTVNTFAGTISLFRNTAIIGTIGTSSFAAPVAIGLIGCTAINAGDIDGDGKPDLAVTSGFSDTLYLLRNMSVPGTFTFSATVSVPASAPQEDLTISDIDGDGRPDIITANYTANTVSVFRNAATSGAITPSSLSAPYNITTPGTPAGIAVDDIDGDLKPDIAVVNGSTATVSIFRNYPLPPVSSITGADSICAATATTLSDATPGGTWVSSNTAIAVISPSGVASGIAEGVDTIMYYTVARGDTNTARHILTVNAYHPVGIITAATNMFCAGATLPLNDTPAHGHWTSSNPAVATVDTSGFVTGHSAGNVIITYAIANTCGATSDTILLTVTPASSYVIGSIAGASATCVSSSVTFTDTTIGGSWGSSNTSIATVNSSGLVTGISSGNATITYGITNSCGTYVATSVINIDTSVIAGTLSGADSVCQGASVTLSYPQPGGIWMSSNASATAAGGIVTGITPGTDTITYTLTNTCGSVAISKTIIIKSIPHAGTITGVTNVCPSATITLADVVSGGVWGRTNTRANISATGIVIGVAGGLDTIRYMVTNSCGTDTTTKNIYVIPPAHAGTITGAAIVCIGATITLHDTSLVGVWTISNGHATVADSLVTGISNGTDTVTLTVTNICGSSTATRVLTVTPALVDPGIITGPASVCARDTIYLTDTITGGTWGRTNSTATVSNSGMVIGVTAGTDTIKYSITNTCGAAIALFPVTIKPLPAPGVITGATTVCAGSSIIVKDTTAGGVWSITNALATLTGDSMVTGFIAGNDSVLYTVTNSCGTALAIKKITILPLPYAAVITGASSVYKGDTVILRDSISGGQWITKNSDAFITVSGTVIGYVPGIDTIGYVVTNSCGKDTSLKYVEVLEGNNSGTITNFQVYPNPGRDNFTVNLTSRINENLLVLLSNSVFQSISIFTVPTNTPTSIPVDLPSGNYFLSALTKGGWYTVKIVVLH